MNQDEDINDQRHFTYKYMYTQSLKSKQWRRNQFNSDMNDIQNTNTCTIYYEEPIKEFHM